MKTFDKKNIISGVRLAALPLLGGLALSLLAACADGYNCYLKVDEPESVKNANELAALDVLKNNVNKSANPNFKFGLSVGAADYVNKGLTYSIAKTNFDAVVDNNVMLYSATVADDGTYNFVSVTDMSIEDSPAVLGGKTIAYNTVNKNQLNSVISPKFIKGDLKTGTITLADFAGDQVGATYEMTNGSTGTVVEDPAGKSGNVLSIGSATDKAKNTYPVINVNLADGLTLGDLKTLTFDIYCVDDKSLKRPLVIIVDGVRQNFSTLTPDKFGCPLGDWGRKLITLDITAAAITEEQKAKTSFTISVGVNVNSSYYYIDNVTAAWSTGVPDRYEEQTAEEKAQSLSTNFGAWAKALMTKCAPFMTDYIVVSDPMSDSNEYMQRTADNELACGNDTANCFFFNDYMGDNYVKTITDSLSKAHSACGVNTTPVFYVSESGMLDNINKAERLVLQINEWTAAGAKIDGISFDLPLTYSDNATEQTLNKAKVTDLFKTLAASGKLLRVNAIQMDKANADYYKFVVKEYLTLVPAAQRAGIVFGGTGDLWKNNSRSDVYKAVVEAMK